ncbi:MAG: hypothetical protein IPL67_10475 [Ignavibacteria bacterium]|nr:hypothetical protein [Ignavibacteria bacterium]
MLGLTDAERLLIVTPKALIPDQQLIWNAPAPWNTNASPDSVLEYMTRVDHFLDKTGITYKEMDLLFKLTFSMTPGSLTNPTKHLFIKHNDLTCNTEKKEIVNLTVDSLDRIHRFLRLQKKTGWSFEVLDEIISQTKLGTGILDDACLIIAAKLQKLSTETGIKVSELLGFYGDIPHKIIQDNISKPLYHQVFLNKAKNGFIDDGLLPTNIGELLLI